jgi:hypothetical protein
MKTAIISILYKKGDSRDIKNYRPVSLLTIDYKVITKVLKSRLSRVIGGLVHPDQACGIPKRSINDQLFNIQAVIERASSSGGALVAIDLRKAYDLISHDFMHEVLRDMNFGENFRKWIKILYQDPESMVLVNGFLSESFKVGRSVRQGCPLSTQLFVLCQEPLASAIRAEPRIKGIKVPNAKEVKNITFADDATHPITANCIKTIFEIYSDFGKASGSEVNLDKTEVLLLGTFTANIFPAEFRRFIVKAATLLGIPWDKNGACGEIFWPKTITKIKTAAEKWEGRRLSFVGKVLVIKTMLLSKLWYGARLINISKKFAKQVERVIFKFLWSGKAETIKRSSLVRDPKDGGIGMPHVLSRCRALFMEKLKYLYAVENIDLLQPWIGYGIYRAGVTLRHACPRIAVNTLVHNINGADGVWQVILKLCQESKLKLGRDEWENTTAARIYGKLLKQETMGPHTVCTKVVNKNFENVWHNIWKNKVLTNNEKELYFKIAHRAVPVKAMFKGFPQAQTTCTTCGTNLRETIEHVFFYCQQVQPVLGSLQTLLPNNALNVVSILYPDLCKATPDLHKTVATLGIFIHVIWSGRAAIWKGKVHNMQMDFLQRTQKRL